MVDYESERKRSKESIEADDNGVNLDDKQSSKDSGDGKHLRTKACVKFFSTSGCPYGEGCHFLHFLPSGVSSVGSLNSNAAAAYAKLISYEMPKMFVPASVMDTAVGSGGYKSRVCNKYNTQEGCRFGKNCHFAHVDNATVTNLLPPPSYQLQQHHHDNNHHQQQPVAASRMMSIKAGFVGAIIGKGGAHVKEINQLTGAKLFIREHESDPSLRNVEVAGHVDQIEMAAEMVRQLLQHIPSALSPVATITSPTAAATEMTTATATETATPAAATAAVAATSALPPGFGFGFPNNFKTKLCQNYAVGSCTFGDRCHFAHGGSELRISDI